MPAPTSSAEVFDLILKSGLIAPDRLAPFMERYAAAPLEPNKLAQILIQEGLITHFQARQLLKGRYRGFALGKYLVLEQLGEGGMGKVFLCVHLLMRRRVAIKVLSKELASDPGTVERFQREARAVAALDHPNIVRAHDVDCEGDTHFIVMEYVDGASLHEIVRRQGALPVPRACHYVRQAAVGLQEVLRCGMIHRDIKPGNLLLDRKGVIKILDLGLARFEQDKRDHLTQQFDEGSVLGTADYLSPEQAMNSHNVDIRTDIYSLGATLYFLLAGRPPFEGGSVTQKLLFHQMRNPPSLKLLRPDLDENLVAVIEKMMAKDPADRYQTPAEVAAALEPWCRTPIPPPAEAELPSLCKAARLLGTPEGGPLPQALATSPAGSVATKASLVATGAAMRAFPGGNSGRHAGVAAFPGDLAAPPLSAVPISSSQISSSQVLLMSGVQSGFHRDAATGRESPSTAGGTSRRRGPKSSGKMAKRRRNRWMVLGVGGFIALCLLTYFFLLPGGSKGRDQELFVSRSRTGPNVYKTLAEAWEKRDPTVNGRIVVEDDEINEQLLLKGNTGLGRRVQWSIEGSAPPLPPPEGEPPPTTPPGRRRVRWAPAPGADTSRPLLRIENGSGISLVRFEFDGGDQIQDLCVLSGRMANFSMTLCQFHGAKRSGLTLQNCTSGGTISHVEADFFAGRNTEYHMRFEASPEDPQWGTDGIALQRCEFHMKPETSVNAAILVNSPLNQVTVRQCSFLSCNEGIVFRRADRLGMELEKCIFDRLKAGLRFESLPLRQDGKGIVATENRFFKTGITATVDGFVPERLTTAKWIWSLEQGQPFIQAPTGKRYFRTRFNLDGASPTEATLDITADDTFTVWLNEQQVGSGGLAVRPKQVSSYNLLKYLQAGENALCVEAENRPDAAGKMTPAGLLAQLSFDPPLPSATALASDASWKVSKQRVAGWTKVDFDDSGWSAAHPMLPYKQEKHAAWSHLIWESVISKRYQGSYWSIIRDPTGNLRDDKSEDGYPSFETTVNTKMKPGDQF